MENPENPPQEQRLSRHQLKQLKRQQREEEERKKQESFENTKKRKKIIKYSIYGLMALVVIFGLIKLFSGSSDSTDGSSNSGPYTSGPVHWHASLDVYICGEKVLVPEKAPLGEHHLGLPLLHTHADSLIHIEGQIWKKEDIALGRYMDVIGEKFSSEQILNKKNGDLCNGTPGKVNMFVNGKENLEFRDFSPKDGDKIEIKFE